MDNSTKLSARQQRALSGLLNHPEGIRSYDLRQIAGVMNIADLIGQLRVKGYRIDCRMEDHEDQDGKSVQVGRYFLEK